MSEKPKYTTITLKTEIADILREINEKTNQDLTEILTQWILAIQKMVTEYEPNKIDTINYFPNRFFVVSYYEPRIKAVITNIGSLMIQKINIEEKLEPNKSEA